MQNKKIRVFFLFLIAFYSIPSNAQNLLSFTDPKSDTLKGSIIRKKSPGMAMLYSALLPGAGQFYNESYWKIPIILGLAAYWGYEWNDLNKNYKNYKNLYSSSLTLYPPDGVYQYKLIRDFYRTERDKFAWYLGILYFANILDAYVDANLFEFDVGENLSNVSTGKIFSMKIKIFL